MIYRGSNEGPGAAGKCARVAVLFALSGLLLPGLVRAQDATPVSITPRIRPQRSGLAGSIRLDVNVVLIPVTVTDPLGKPVSGLPTEDFHLFEDGVEQRVRMFSNEDAPLSVGFLFDSSGSMEKKLDKSRQAIAEFFKTTLPGDEFLLIGFNDAPKLLCNFTPHAEDIQDRLAFIKPEGWTSMLDAVYLSVQKMRRAKNAHKAVILLSDGGDNASRYSETEIRNLVREADVTIYSIGILGAGLSKRNVRLLTELAEETGGRMYPVEKVTELPDAVEKISAAVRNQYVLGYVPEKAERDGKYHKIEVRLSQPADQPPLRASWRTGYYAAGR